MKKKLIGLTVLTVALSFGMGALSLNTIAQLREEFQTRATRELVNRDLVASISPTGREYFQGRSDGAAAAAKFDYTVEFMPEYLQGFGESLIQAGDLIARAHLE